MVDVELHLGDCLEIMPVLAGPFDAIIADLPYGTTACKWDTVIPFEPLWEQYKRLIKPRGAVVLFGSQPFTSELVMSNPGWFKYCWVWDKVTAHGLRAKYRPVLQHEDICVFSSRAHNYYPIKTPRERPIRQKIRSHSPSARMSSLDGEWRTYTDKHPKSILVFHNRNGGGKFHPTQKPVALLEYLIRTYTNEGETVLDNCFGSCTTGVACLNTGRNFVGIEKDEGYFRIAQSRIAAAQSEMVQASFETAS